MTRQANELRVISFFVEQAGVRVPSCSLPEVLGPNWFELDTLDLYNLTDAKVLTSCLAEALLGETWPDDAPPPERADFLARLQAAAADRGWEAEVAPAAERRWSLDIWRGLSSTTMLPEGATTKRPPGYKQVDEAVLDRTGDVLVWYAEVSGIVLGKADLEQLPGMNKTVRSIYRLYGLDHDMPDLEAMRA